LIDGTEGDETEKKPLDFKELLLLPNPRFIGGLEKGWVTEIESATPRVTVWLFSFLRYFVIKANALTNNIFKFLFFQENHLGVFLR